MFWILRTFFSKILWILMVPILAGFAGIVHPIGDSFAVFRPHFLVLLGPVVAILLICGARYRGAFGLVVAVYCIYSMMPFYPSSTGTGQDVTVYQKNLLVLTSDTSALQRDIFEQNADIVMLQELDDRNLSILNDLRTAYPYQHLCNYNAIGSVAVLSRWPATGDVLPCNPDDGLAAMLVDTGRHRIWVASQHLRWPWPYAQAAQAGRISETIGALNWPLVMAGDMNGVPWSYAMRDLARAGNIVPAASAGFTFTLRDLPVALPLDHVFMPEGARGVGAEKRPKFGSDHNGVVVRFELP